MSASTDGRTIARGEAFRTTSASPAGGILPQPEVIFWRLPVPHRLVALASLFATSRLRF